VQIAVYGNAEDVPPQQERIIGADLLRPKNQGVDHDEEKHVLCAVCALFVLAGCGATKPADVVMNARDAFKDGKEGSLDKYYTAKTVEMITELKELTKNLPDTKDPVARNFEQGDMEIVKEEIEGETAYVTVRYKWKKERMLPDLMWSMCSRCGRRTATGKLTWKKN
jgi:hypothetical protein